MPGFLCQWRSARLRCKVSCLTFLHDAAQGRAFRPSGITSLICEFSGLSDVVSLHGGLPPAAAFPIAGMSLRLANGNTIDIDEPKLVREFVAVPRL